MAQDLNISIIEVTTLHRRVSGLSLDLSSASTIQRLIYNVTFLHIVDSGPGRHLPGKFFPIIAHPIRPVHSNQL